MTGVKCCDCGRFCKPVEWKMVYSGGLPAPDYQIYKCANCAMKRGSFEPQYGIVAEFSCGKVDAK